MSNCNKKTNCSDCVEIVKGVKGSRGKGGTPGVPGADGIDGAVGPQGIPGTPGAPGAPGIDGAAGAVGPQGPPGSGSSIMDTNWKNLDGFSHYSGAPKPQVRRIGNTLHFRGVATVPLSILPTSTTAISLLSLNGYDDKYYNNTFVGANGCSIPVSSGTITTGQVLFNLGLSCIPISITAAGNLLDGTYVKKNVIATREIILPDGVESMSYSCVVSVGFTPNKNLFISTMQALEKSDGTAVNNLIKKSPLHLITSYASNTAGSVTEKIPVYKIIDAATDFNVHGANTSNVPNILQNFTHASLQHQFNIDLGMPKTIGGLQVQLDGLMAFLEPCNTETNLGTIC